MESKFSLLASQPHIGRARPELLTQLRSLPIGRYMAFYIPVADAIELVRVLHSARDIGAVDFESKGSA